MRRRAPTPVEPSTAEQIAALRDRVHQPAPPTITRTCKHCGVRGEVDPTTACFIVGIDGTEVPFGVCDDCEPYGGDHRSLSAHAVAVVLGVKESDEAVQKISVAWFADRASIGQATSANRTRWEHLGRERLAEQVQRARREIAERTSDVPCPFCGVTRTAPGTRWTQPPGHNSPVMCGGCSAMFSNGDGGWWPGGQWRSIAAGSLIGITGRMFRLGEEVGLLFWSESGRTKPNAKAWAHVDRVSMYRRALRLPPSSFGGNNCQPWLGMVEAVAAADAEKLTDEDRAAIVVAVNAAVRGDGTRKRLAARYGVGVDVIRYVAREPVPA